VSRCDSTVITVSTTSVRPALSSLKSHMAGQIVTPVEPCLLPSKLSWGGGQLSLPRMQAERGGGGGFFPMIVSPVRSLG
jgi:hypothetical protein